VIATDARHTSDLFVVPWIEDINPSIGGDGFSGEVGREGEHDRGGVMTKSLRVESWEADSITGFENDSTRHDFVSF
jgi:hypothetical protein